MLPRVAWNTGTLVPVFHLSRLAQRSERRPDLGGEELRLLHAAK